MSYGAFVAADMAERRARQALPVRERERRRRALALVGDKLGDVGDGFAVYALLALWGKRGEGNVTASMVRQERRRLIDRNGWDMQ
jgi:hypothetical protein